MRNSDNSISPTTILLTDQLIKKVIDEAKEILEKVGVQIHAQEGLELLANAGARVDQKKQQAFIPGKLVDDSLSSVPSSFKLYDRNGQQKVVLGDDNVYFQPTSSNIKVWDSEKEQNRDPMVQDLIEFVRVVDALDYLPIQTTNYYPVDIPKEIASIYRNFICLKTSAKPLFASVMPTPMENVETMIQFVMAIRGTKEALEKKPLILCPVPIKSPLTWFGANYHMLTQYARNMIPIMICTAPAIGVSGPVSILGVVTQQIAEFFSGVVITQLTQPGAPVMAGNYAEFFDMRLGTTCMGTIENYMADMACAEVAYQLDIPSHVFMGCSDAKRPDFQAGLESGIGLILGALGRANIVHSAGGLNDIITTSLEKLVIDNEICGMAYRLLKGITPRGERLAEDLFTEGIFNGDHFLTSPNTTKWFKKEAYYPGKTINRESIESWQEAGSTSAEQRAREEVKRILTTHNPKPLDSTIDKELIDIMTRYAKQNGTDELPRV